MNSRRLPLSCSLETPPPGCALLTPFLSPLPPRHELVSQRQRWPTCHWVGQHIPWASCTGRGNRGVIGMIRAQQQMANEKYGKQGEQAQRAHSPHLTFQQTRLWTQNRGGIQTNTSNIWFLFQYALFLSGFHIARVSEVHMTRERKRNKLKNPIFSRLFENGYLDPFIEHVMNNSFLIRKIR